MNVFDDIQGSRPYVEPMPLPERRRIRESLFGLGHDDATRTIRDRSESGAVVATAPHGMRRPIEKRPRPAGSIARLGAGLLVLAALGAVVWSYSTRQESTAGTATTSTTTTSSTTTTLPPPSTVAPIVRTGVDPASPLALPPASVAVEDATIGAVVAGSSAAVLGAPDGTEVWMAEFDGDPADASGLDVRRVGAIGVGIDREPADDAPTSYRPQVPCGVVIVNDALGQPLDRQPMIDLFSAMSIDSDATIDVTLPENWSVLSIGESQTSYTVQFRLPAPGFGFGAPLRLTQVPGGSFAQLMFGGRQVDPIEFLGGPAFVEVDPPDPSLASVYWQDGATVFNASSNALTVADLEAFVETLEPVGVADWNARFATSEPVAAGVESQCAPQPDFGATLQL